MKKGLWLVAAIAVFTFSLAIPGYAWQGRMAGMGDVYGLVEDESDFLTHPAAIANGKGVNYYGTARYTYDKTTKWDIGSTSIGFPLSTWSYAFPYEADGHENKYEGQLGVAFPVGTGRMGVFFDYTGKRGDYSGNELYYDGYGAQLFDFDAKNYFDNYAVRFLYGVPVNGIKLGAELQIAYRDEENRESIGTGTFWGVFVSENYMWNADNPELNLYPYMIPFNSQYWEALGKISMESEAGPVKYALTFKGGLPFASDNKYEYKEYNYGYMDASSMRSGSVTGYNFGADFWFRYALRDNLSLPFVISAGYDEKERDGSGIPIQTGWIDSYDHESKSAFIELGGGVDYSPCKGARVAGGLYYDYQFKKENLTLTTANIPNSYLLLYDYPNYPKQAEHRITLKFLGERSFNPSFSLRGGMNIFYGWVTMSDYESQALWGSYPMYQTNLSGTGYTFGAGASVGATFTFNKVSFEPFINGGYKKIDITGDGLSHRDMQGFTVHLTDDSYYKRDNWFIGGGFSIRF